MRETNRDKFDVKAARTECNYCGRTGATIAKLVANRLFAKLQNYRSHVVIFDIGTNDPDKLWADTAELAGDLFQLARRCMAEFGVQTVRFSRCFQGDPGVSARERQTSQQRICARSAKTGANLAVVKSQRFAAMTGLHM